ncbi:hypothetical protein WJX82_004509 [Trebouxia sp. C0006]
MALTVSCQATSGKLSCAMRQHLWMLLHRSSGPAGTSRLLHKVPTHRKTAPGLCCHGTIAEPNIQSGKCLEPVALQPRLKMTLTASHHTTCGKPVCVRRQHLGLLPCQSLGPAGMPHFIECQRIERQPLECVVKAQ